MGLIEILLPGAQLFQMSDPNCPKNRQKNEYNLLDQIIGIPGAQDGNPLLLQFLPGDYKFEW